MFSLSIGIELLTPAFPQYFLLLASIANVAKQISLACYLATGVSFRPLQNVEFHLFSLCNIQMYKISSKQHYVVLINRCFGSTFCGKFLSYHIVSSLLFIEALQQQIILVKFLRKHRLVFVFSQLDPCVLVYSYLRRGQLRFDLGFRSNLCALITLVLCLLQS